MIHVVCLDCACESWSGGGPDEGEPMAREFERAHEARGHLTERKPVRTPRSRDVPDVDHRDGRKDVRVVETKGRL